MELILKSFCLVVLGFVVLHRQLMKKISYVDQPRNTSKDPLHIPNGPMTRSKTKTLKETLNTLVLKVATKLELNGTLEFQEEALVHLIHVQEGPNTI